jgi:hypothetical protein
VSLKKYFYNLGVGVDQLFNAILGGNPDQTVSGRLGKRIQEGKATKFEIVLCRILSFLDPYTNRHCVDSIDIDET